LPNLNDKPDFDQLPFLIMPPMWGFYIVKADIALPATKPFTHSEQVAFPRDARSITVVDADGPQSVRIAEVTVPDFVIDHTTEGGNSDLCVFRLVGLGGSGGINPFMIAKCDAIVPGIYARVFGPASRADCEKYIRDNGGLA
jgi:hypothetical protein